ncbi:hypothetical protein OIY81_2824 [Cryptosporidium canis]|uniref:SAP domain-containing protein n=1 Tax=Cryptosporidium canis TaxID=195482 RepID=A0ABQ8P501_9CRYT|nr:hypothetical protein OIY81_2824 [Cryptosporidium canis]KAJ1608507.1 hypothetical protein OJ252_2512 [Cryptosporidium canis]
MSSLSEILVEVERRGGKEDVEVELSGNLSEGDLSRLREQLFMMGFELQAQGADSEGRRLVLKKEHYNELAVREVSNASVQNKEGVSGSQTPKSALKSKKDNFMDKSQRMDEELAAVRAEKAKQYKNSSGSGSSRGANNACSTSSGAGGSSDSHSSFRRFMNFDWFTSMFSSRRRGTTQRERMHLDSSYYRSKNTGCCGSGCG